jgi:predicted GNAT family N-acyltransferase
MDDKSTFFLIPTFVLIMGKSISIQPANSTDLRKAIFEVRKAVFVVEQNVSESKEYDEFETSSTHLAAILEDLVVGTCRYRSTAGGVKLERFAVLKKYRGMDVGKNLLAHCLHLLGAEADVYLHAQVQVVGFYALFGFEKVGDQFEEAGIRHFKMVLKDRNVV